MAAILRQIFGPQQRADFRPAAQNVYSIQCPLSGIILEVQNPFWRLEYPTPLVRLAEWNHGAMKSALQGIKCPVNPGHQRGGARVINLNVVVPDGQVQSFVWTWYSECLLQDLTLKMLRSEGLTGFEVEPVTARFRKSTNRPPKLWELVVTGWAGMAKAESGIHLNQAKSCPVCGHLTYTGLINPQELIDTDKWDGSDFFMVWPMPRYVFVSQRAAKIIRDHHLTGGRLVPISELEPTDGFAPGRLHYYMPEQMARELGEPLGIY